MLMSFGSVQFSVLILFGFKGCYMTIHITPEPEFSYVSFETNAPSSSYKEVIQKVLDTFRPSKFLITVFANQVRINFTMINVNRIQCVFNQIR